MQEMTMMVAERTSFSENLLAAAEKTAARVGIEIREENRQKIAQYGNELRKWNKAYNLIGRKIGEEGLIDLYCDAMTPLCLRGLLADGTEALDAGSGAGMPGIPLYLAAGPFPLTLVEPQRKKIAFLRHICKALELEEIRIYAGRLEDMSREEDHLNAYELGFSRAVMDPVRMLRHLGPLLCDGGRAVLFVGKSDGERIRKSASSLADRGFDLEAVRSTQRIIGKDNYLVVIRKSGRQRRQSTSGASGSG